MADGTAPASAAGIGGFAALRRLYGRYFHSARLLAISGLFIVVVATADLVCPLLMMSAIDRLLTAHANGGDAWTTYVGVLLLALGMGALVVGQYLARYGMSRVQNQALFRGTAHLRGDLYARLQARSVDAAHERRLGELLTHLVGDVQMLQDAALELLSDLPFDLCILLGLVAAMFYLNPGLGAVVLCFLAVAAAVSFVMGRSGWQSQERAMRQLEDLNARFEETLGAGKVLQRLDATASEAVHVAAANRELAEGLEANSRVSAAVAPFFGFSEYLGLLMVLLAGGWCLLHGSLTAGGLVAFMAYMQLAAEPMARTGRVLPRLQRAVVSARRLCDLLDAHAPAAGEGGGLRPQAISGELSARGLGFAYAKAAGATTSAALNGLDFSIQPGQRVAIIGHNAAGKSTLLDLLLRLHRPASGALTVDGLDLQSLDLAWWRGHIGVVPQDTLVLNRSLADNISLGLTGIDRARIVDAAERAGIHAMIAAMPRGYDTVAGERGAALSGGQRQRLAIARLFLRDPRIVLLDEPTSALDIESEAAVGAALERLCAGRTVFIVSHRAALLHHVDRVLLLERGRQLAFATPGAIWRDFPHHRALFPNAWGADHPSPGADHADQAIPAGQPQAHAGDTGQSLAAESKAPGVAPGHPA
jgi:subfamily B ATP-binding cassette protein MsbA